MIMSPLHLDILLELGIDPEAYELLMQKEDDLLYLQTH